MDSIGAPKVPQGGVFLVEKILLRNDSDDSELDYEFLPSHNTSRIENDQKEEMSQVKWGGTQC